MTSSQTRQPVLRSVRSAPPFSSLRAISALILREMSTSYGRSPGGYVWAVLEPVLAIAVLSAVFAAGFRNPQLGTNFPIFYATGFMPFMMFLQISAKVSQSINYSQQLLSYPRVTFVDAVIARFVLATLTQLVVAYIVFAGILAIWETRTTLDLTDILLSFAMAAVLGLGIGLVNCTLITRFPIWQQVWSVLTRPLVIISGVILLHDSIPNPYRDWLDWNPLVHVTGVMRRAFYHGYDASYIDVAYPFLIGGLGTLIGLLVLRRSYRDFLER